MGAASRPRNDNHRGSEIPVVVPLPTNQTTILPLAVQDALYLNMNMKTRAEIENHIRNFLTYGNETDVTITEQVAHYLLGGIIDGETHASFKDRAARQLSEIIHPIMSHRVV